MPRIQRQGVGIWLLFYQIFGVIGLNNIPPTTLILTIVQVLIFLRIIPVPWHHSSDVCISVDSVWHRKDWIRLLYGAVEHGSDWHLYYNMISLIWKGMSLERRFGSARFGYIISVFTALCGITLIGLCQLAGEYASRKYYHQCAVGFSGILFALKVLTTHYWPQGSQRIMGLPIDMPVKYLVWVELFLIQLLVPNASFLGHLAGILVGLAYLHTPVGSIIDTGWNIIEPLFFGIPSSNRFRSNNTSGYSNPRMNVNVQPGMTEDEQFEFARQESMRSSFRPSGGNQPYSSGREEDDLLRATDESLRSFNARERRTAPYPETMGAFPTQRPPYPETDLIPPTVPSGKAPIYPDLDEMREKRSQRFNWK